LEFEGAMAAMDFSEQLAKQLGFLRTSCREYDDGNVDEAIRIATGLRVIFHHTAASTSLLMHLRATIVRVLSTAGKRQATHPDGFWPALIQMEFDVAANTLRCLPAFNARAAAHRFLPATAWWDSEMVFYGGHKKFKRKQLVLHAANKDGGAHVDSALPADYEWLIEGADVAFGFSTPDGQQFMNKLPNPHLAHLRQMGFEVLNSPDLVKLAGQ
jgi:hypothetical protein